MLFGGMLNLISLRTAGLDLMEGMCKIPWNKDAFINEKTKMVSLVSNMTRQSISTYIAWPFSSLHTNIFAPIERRSEGVNLGNRTIDMLGFIT